MTVETTELSTAEISEKRHAFNAAIAANDALLRSIADSIVEAPTVSLLQGTWTVRDGMCHVAARANSVAMVQAIAAGAFDTEGASASLDIDAMNQAQIAERTEKIARDLIDETIAGHARSITELAHLDDAFLASMITLPFLPQPVSAIDLIAMVGPAHDASHLAEIQAALDAQ